MHKLGLLSEFVIFFFLFAVYRFSMTQDFLPYGRQDISEDDIAAVVATLRADFLTTGPKVAEFETVFATYAGVPHAVAVANGTAALHLASLALGIEPGDCVLAPTVSFAASANGAMYCGAQIMFMDCDPDTGLVTPETFQQAIDRCVLKGKTPKMAVIVHLNGEHADMASIARIAQSHDIALVEDACHALGTEFEDEEGVKHRVGACRYSAISTYSTHPVKTITTGEGGVITTRDDTLAERLKLLRNHGIERDATKFRYKDLALDSQGNPNPWYYEMQVSGFNYRLTDIACALGISQMQRMDEIASRRRKLKSQYDTLLNGINANIKPVLTMQNTDPVRHLYPLLIDFDAIGMERAQFCRAMRARGIGTQVHYVPIHLQPFYREQQSGLSLPGADAYYRRALSIPLFPTMKDDDPNRVVNAISDILTQCT